MSITIQPALTTTFVPAASCFDSVIYYNGQDQIGPRPTPTECYPPGWRPGPGVYFPPGFCPNGYTSAIESTNVINTLTETVVNCCPSSWSWTADANKPQYTTCLSYYDRSATRTVEVYSGAFVNSTFVGAAPGYATATAIQVRFQSTDQAVLSPGEQTPATATATVTASAAPTGMSTALKFGLGVGIPLVLILAAAVGVGVFMLLRRSKKAKSEDVYEAPQHGDVSYTKNSGQQMTVMRELDGVGRPHELDGQPYASHYG